VSGHFFELELETERRVARSRQLSAFRRNATTWELLLMLAAHNGKSDLGLYNTLDQLETGYLGQSAMLKFLRDRRSDGLLEFEEHDKKSMWRLRLSSELHDELVSLLEERNIRLSALEVQGPGSYLPGDRTAQVLKSAVKT